MLLSYIIRRLFSMVPVLLIVAMISFAIVHLAPGDPAVVMLGDDATASDIEAMREQLGFNDPIYVQFARYIGQLLRGDLGTSLFFGDPVLQTLWERAEPTVLLTVMGLALTVLIGIPLGIVAALRRNSVADQTVLVVSLFGLAMPNFWLGLNLILLFSLVLGWLPSSGYVWIREGGILGAATTLILPAISVGFSRAALISRMTRTSMLEVLGQDYIRTARSKGLAGYAVIFNHALKNSLIPVVTVVGISLATLISGSVVTETVFALPGIGRLMVQSIFRRDFPVIQGTLIVVALLYVVINLIVDLVYTMLDVRITYE